MLHPISVIFILICIWIYYNYYHQKENQLKEKDLTEPVSNILKQIKSRPNSFENILDAFNRNSYSIKRVSLDTSYTDKENFNSNHEIPSCRNSIGEEIRK